ncbi:hypothetical protein K0M31_003924 [Melipona bicolor]|uniref:Uncharacterized protein n=1 Tax=Melipona bicolor TaxID=60889 RepID=A0AA40FXT8_9HYME|nr:hypothetical protein K0M31_003924 [Melipona bicolor]
MPSRKEKQTMPRKNASLPDACRETRRSSSSSSSSSKSERTFLPKKKVAAVNSLIYFQRRLPADRYDTAYACEGKILRIECGEGKLIHLIRANYGRFSITICNEHGNTDWSVNCMSPKSFRVLNSE